MRIARTLLFFFLAAALPVGAAPTPMTWCVEGVDRQAIVYPPSRAAESGKAPVILAFHGHGGHATGVARQMAFQDRWPEALVVYPQGLDTPTKVDPKGRLPGWQRFPGEDEDRDLRFVDVILETIGKQYTIDEDRIYATGFSNGAIFTFLLWSQRASTFAAFAPVAGLLWPPSRVSVPRPLLFIGGEMDPLVRSADQQGAVAGARRLNGCVEAGEKCGPICTLYGSSKGAPVVTWIHPGGHVYPEFAPEVTIQFFRSHSKNAR